MTNLKGFCKNTVDVDACTYDLSTPLHHAVSNNQAMAAEILLDHGADIERRHLYDCKRFTPLHLAIESRALEATTVLVKRGADVMAVTDPALTPFALIRDSPALYLDLLLEAGAKILTRDIFDVTSLMCCLVETNDGNTAKRMFEQHAVNKTNTELIPSGALCYASGRGSLKITDLLLKHGADINSKGYWDKSSTALHGASSNGRLAVLSLLLSCDTDIDAQDSYGRTALCRALAGCHEDCVLALIHHGADVNTQDQYGVTALHRAAVQGNRIVIDEFLKYHATTDIGSMWMITVKYSNESFLEVIEYDSDVFAVNTNHISHVDCDKQMHITIFRPFAVSKDPLVMMSLFWRWKEELLEARIWKDGLTALDIAILSENEDIASLLKPLTTPSNGSGPISVEDHFFDLLGVSSEEEAWQELDRRGVRHHDTEGKSIPGLER